MNTMANVKVHLRTCRGNVNISLRRDYKIATKKIHDNFAHAKGWITAITNVNEIVTLSMIISFQLLILKYFRTNYNREI